jgi:hypothetical protein
MAERAIPTSDPSWKFVAFQKKSVPATRTGTLGGEA